MSRCWYPAGRWRRGSPFRLHWAGGLLTLEDSQNWPSTEVGPLRRWRTPKRYNGSGKKSGVYSGAAPQDWMCEPQILRATGMSVQEHQRRTVANFIDLRQRWPGPDCPVIPVLQGWTIPDYLACLAMYRAEGIDLVAEPLVGLGSVCRRQATREVAGLVMRLAGMGLKLHGFGVKGGSSVRPLLESADSMAWSYKARIEGIRLPGHPHRKCSNCLPWALQWARNLQDLGATPCQGSLL